MYENGGCFAVFWNTGDQAMNVCYNLYLFFPVDINKEYFFWKMLKCTFLVAELSFVNTAAWSEKTRYMDTTGSFLKFCQLFDFTVMIAFVFWKEKLKDWNLLTGHFWWLKKYKNVRKWWLFHSFLKYRRPRHECMLQSILLFPVISTI